MSTTTLPARVAPYLVAGPSSSTSPRTYALAGYTTDEDVSSFISTNSTFSRAAWIGLLPESERSDPLKFPQSLPTGLDVKHVAVTVPQLLTPETSDSLIREADALLTSDPSRPLIVSCATARRAGAVLALFLARTHKWTPEEMLSFSSERGLSFTTVQPLRNWVVSSVLRWRATAADATSTSATNALCAAAALDGQSLGGLAFRQLWDTASSTFTYLLADPTSRECVLIDPVLERAERDASLVRELGLRLTYILDTHVHADHITGCGALKKVFPEARSVLSVANSTAAADLHLQDGAVIPIGSSHAITLRTTPGHTGGCASYVLDGGVAVFTGDTLLVRGCGRTDFQVGSSDALYDSVTNVLFTLPPNCTVYPAHDYNGYTSSTIREEKALNPRLGAGRSKAEFMAIMAALQLPRPAKMDIAVPANLNCGAEAVVIQQA